MNENKPHVMETGMNFVIISIPKTESMILEASFSYQSSTRGNLMHSLKIRCYTCLLYTSSIELGFTIIQIETQIVVLLTCFDVSLFCLSPVNMRIIALLVLGALVLADGTGFVL